VSKPHPGTRLRLLYREGSPVGERLASLG
jgi:hypothetical protein